MSIERCSIRLHCKAGAKHNKVGINDSGEVVVAVSSPPTDGKANRHLIALLSKHLHIPKSRFTISRGITCRKKQISIEGISGEKALQKFQKITERKK